MSERHVLIIDDQQSNINALGALLKQENIDYSFITEPRNLTRVIDGLPQISAVFLDLEFPNYDGMDLLGELRAHHKLEDVPIIAYTVHTSEMGLAQTAGFDGFLGKPLNVQRFVEHIQRILDGEQVWDDGD